MIKIGIECENIEDKGTRYGVGQLTLNLLKEYAANSEWQSKYKLYLYFKKQIPDDEFIQNPIFIKRVMGLNSFNIFYHILLPIRAMLDRLDWMFFPNYMLPPLYLGKSVVILTNDIYYEFTKGTIPFRYKLAYRLFANWAAKKATKIMAISEASKKEIVKLFKMEPERIFVARLGVSGIAGDQRSLPSDQAYILYVGQMFPRRHARESILAFEKIAPDFPALKFILLGKDKYNPPIIDGLVRETNQKLGKEAVIHYDYLEKREEVGKLYAGAKLFVYISDNEAFGLPPVEAASYGIPVAVKDSDLNHELFEDAAFFAPDSSPETIADIFRDGLANNEKREYCIKKYREIIPGLNWHNFADKFFNQL